MMRPNCQSSTLLEVIKSRCHRGKLIKTVFHGKIYRKGRGKLVTLIKQVSTKSGKESKSGVKRGLSQKLKVRGGAKSGIKSEGG